MGVNVSVDLKNVLQTSTNPPRYRVPFQLNVDGVNYDLVRNWPDDLLALTAQGKLDVDQLKQLLVDQTIWAVRQALGV